MFRFFLQLIFFIFFGLAIENLAAKENQNDDRVKTNNPFYEIKVIDKSIYKTYGFGLNETEARNDAIKNGLQYATSQLVITDVVIEGSEVIKDVLYSTMNGYIEEFNVMSVINVEGGVYIEAILKISDSEIKNTIDKFSNVGLIDEKYISKIDSNSLISSLNAANAEIKRKENQLEFASVIVKKMYSGWPSKAYLGSFTGIEIDKNDPTNALIHFSISYEQDWFSQFLEYQNVLNKLTYNWLPSELGRLKPFFHCFGLKERKKGFGPFARVVERFPENCFQIPVYSSNFYNSHNPDAFFLKSLNNLTTARLPRDLTEKLFGRAFFNLHHFYDEKYVGCMSFSSPHTLLKPRGGSGMSANTISMPLKYDNFNSSYFWSDRLDLPKIPRIVPTHEFLFDDQGTTVASNTFKIDFSIKPNPECKDYTHLKPVDALNKR